LGFRAGVLPERGAVRLLRAVDQEVDERPRSAVSQDRPVTAPQRVARLRGEQGAQGDRLTAPYLLYVLPQGGAWIELDPHRSRLDRAGPADVPRLDVQPRAYLRESEVGREPFLEPLRRLVPRPVGPL